MIGALAALDRFTFSAVGRRGPFAVRAHGASTCDLGTVVGEDVSRLEGTLRDARGELVLSWDASTLAGSEIERVSFSDRYGGFVGTCTRDPGARRVCERWVVRNAVSEPVAVIDERGPWRAMLAGFNQPVPRQYVILSAEDGEDGQPVGRHPVGEARRSPTARRWDVRVDGDDARLVDRRYLLAAFAVLVVDQAW